MSSGKVLLGVLAGVAAGALLGVLFAPDKGSATRNRISKKGDDYTDGLKNKFSDFLEDMKENYEEAKGKVTEYSKDGHSKYDGAKAK